VNIEDFLIPLHENMKKEYFTYDRALYQLYRSSRIYRKFSKPM